MKIIFQIFSIVLLFVPVMAQESKTIEIGTFNIRFFPCNQDGQMMKDYDINMTYPPEGLSTDTTMLFDMLRDLDIEVLGVQEIVDPTLFGAMAKRHLGGNYKFIYAPSEIWQKVGILFDTSAVKLIGEPVTHWEVALDEPNRLRPAFSAYFKSIPNGFDFHVIVVHLKSSPKSYEMRLAQWTELEKIITNLPEQDPKDKDIILLGDFNHVSEQGVGEFLAVLDTMDFYWTIGADMTVISSYWRPDWKKPELKSSNIDQIFISRDATEEFKAASLRVGGICAEGHPEINWEFPDYYQKISDHCPVFVSFKTFPDND
jgi:endonuclease/exonuclease/phosphatase family metal-dependent hydrolase